jgi:putative two-component system response regulator
MMPGIDGYEVCRRLEATPATASIPVIFLTAKADVESEQMGFSLGAVDYISKPISPPILLARVKAQLILKSVADFLQDKNAYLEAEVERRTREVSSIQMRSSAAASTRSPCRTRSPSRSSGKAAAPTSTR